MVEDLLISLFDLLPLPNKQGRKRSLICIKCNKRVTFGQRKRKIREIVWDIKHGLPIIHSKD